jgi:hypothetical protein
MNLMKNKKVERMLSSIINKKQQHFDNLDKTNLDEKVIYIFIFGRKKKIETKWMI